MLPSQDRAIAAPRIRHPRPNLLAMGILLTVAWSAAVSVAAQETELAPEQVATPDAKQLDTVVVTATKRALDIDTVPVAVTAIGGDEDPPLIARILGHVHRRQALTGSTPRAPPDLLPQLNLT